jgi:hypothetical protein
MKYIIEIEDEPFGRNDDPYIPHGMDELYRAKGFNTLVFDQFGLDKLTPLDKALEEAYQKGVHDGSIDVKERVDGAYQKGFEAGQHEATTLEYQQGLNDAWECARRLVWETSLNEAEHMGFIAKEESAEILRDYTVTDAMKAVELYDKKLEAEIKVGDEVIPIDAIRRPFVVVSIENNVIHGFELTDGYMSRGCHRDETRWKKTGRHFPQVAELVKAMKGGA